MPLPQEETPGLMAVSDEAAAVHNVHHQHHSPQPSPSVITAHRDHKRKRTKHIVANGALPLHQELTTAWSTIDDDDRRGATEHAMPTGGAQSHRSQRGAPAAAERTTDAGGGASSKNDNALSPSAVVPAPASTSSKAIRVKHSWSSFLIGGGGGKQHPAAGICTSPAGGSIHSYHANNSHVAAAPSASKRLTIRGPAAPSPLLIPAKARRSALTSEAPSAAVPLEVEPVDDECFHKGVEVFGEWDADTQQAEVDRFVRQQQSPPKRNGFSFWLTADEAEADLEYVHRKVEEARRTRKAASGSGKPRRH